MNPTKKVNQIEEVLNLIMNKVSFSLHWLSISFNEVVAKGIPAAVLNVMTTKYVHTKKAYFKEDEGE